MPSKNYLGKFFVALLVGVLILGIAGLVFHSVWVSASEKALTEALIKDVHSLLPNLSHTDAENIRAALSKWSENLTSESMGPILLRDISIAAIISVALIVAIEFYAGQKLREQVAEDVLSGVFRKIIPESIFEEIRSSIIHAPIIRKQWEVRMAVRKDQTLFERDPDLYVSTTIVEYKIESLINRPSKHTIISFLAQDVTGMDSTGQPLPRYVAVSINGNRIAGEDLNEFLTEDGTRYENTITIPRASSGTSTHILLELEEVIRVPDTFYWTTTSATEGAIFNIDTAAI